MADNKRVTRTATTRWPLRRGLVLALLLPMVALASATSTAQLAEQSHRLKKLYDFEDTDDRGNKIGYARTLLPRNWFVIGRRAIGVSNDFHNQPLHRRLENLPGYPQYGSVRFDSSEKVSGDFSLRLGLNGGQTGAFVQTAAITAKDQSDYRVSVQVKTQDLEHAWAELHTYFVDQFGHRIEPSVRKTQPIQTRGRWELVSVKLPGDFTNVAYVGIELHIRQPKRDPDHPLGDFQVVPADITGAAWFDDVAVWELPSVSVTTDARTNVIATAVPPTLHAKVRDLTDRKLHAVMQVYDHRGVRVDRMEDAVEKSGWSWTPDLGGQYGWYWADLSIYETIGLDQRGDLVARSLTGFLWLAPMREPGEDRSRFVVVAEDTPTDHLPLVSEILNQTKLTSVVLSGWERGGTVASTAARARVLEPIARDLLVRRGGVTVSFWPVPVELAAREGVDTQDPLNLLTKASEQWMDYARPFLSPLGQRLNRWQLGSTQKPGAFFADDLAADLLAARAGIRTAAPTPVLVMPWRMDQPPRDTSPSPDASYALAWPQGITHDRLDAALQAWPDELTNTRVDIELADAIDMSHPRRVADLMLRTLHAWERSPYAVGLRKPWAQTYDREVSLTPDPVLGVWVNLSQQLGGQRVIGRMPLEPGLKAMILDGRQGGMLAVWNERADQEPVDVKLYLGETPVAVDPYGNTTPLPSHKGKHTLTVTATPTIIRGIDSRLALMRAGFELDDPFIDSLQVAHRRVLRVHNPWPRTLNGYYLVTGPDRWTVQPQRRQLSIAPGATAEVPVALRFPIFESGGHKPLTAEFVFNVGDDYDVTLTTPMQLGLRGVEFSADAIVEPGDTPGTLDAIVTLSVTNTGDARQTLNIFAGLQGHGRRERILPGIAPGEFATRRIRFKDIGDQIGGSPIRCGVREANGPAVLNQAVELLPPRQQPADDPPVAGVPTP